MVIFADNWLKQESCQVKKIVVTAGGTREPLDPVRFLTNHSTGKQGYAIAQAAIDAGADVTLISTIRNLPHPIGCEVIMVETANEMLEKVLENLPQATALVMSAAVSDFRPATKATQKIKKSTDSTEIPQVPLARNPDIFGGGQTISTGKSLPQNDSRFCGRKSKFTRKCLI